MRMRAESVMLNGTQRDSVPVAAFLPVSPDADVSGFSWGGLMRVDQHTDETPLRPQPCQVLGIKYPSPTRLIPSPRYRGEPHRVISALAPLLESLLPGHNPAESGGTVCRGFRRLPR